MADDALAFAYKHCEDLVRDVDADRFLGARFRPPTSARISSRSTLSATKSRACANPCARRMIGEIRLQWWRDTLQGEARGDVRANPIAAALDDTIVKFRLPRQALVDLIDARVFDLYDDRDAEPERSRRLLRRDLLEPVPVRLASSCATASDPGTADAAGHAGVAYAITGLLRAFPWHARRGQIYVPAEILERHGVVREDIVTGRGGPGLAGALADLRAVARWHLEQTRNLRATIRPAAQPAFRSLALVEPYLRLMERSDYDPFNTPVDMAKWRKIWFLWRGWC